LSVSETPALPDR